MEKLTSIFIFKPKSIQTPQTKTQLISILNNKNQTKTPILNKYAANFFYFFIFINIFYSVLFFEDFVESIDLYPELIWFNG